MRHHADLGIERLEARTCHGGLGRADAGGVEQYLPLQIGCIDQVEIHQAHGAHAGCSQVQRCRRTQSTGADDEYTRSLEPLLAGSANFGKAEVAAVALPLGG